MTRILITRPLPARVIEAAKALFDVELRADTTPLTPAEMRAALARYDGILPTLGDLFSAELFDRVESRRCRILANFGAGTNHIDTAAAGAAGVVVTNTPGVVTDATADIALMLILMSARRAGEGERMLRAGGWPGWHPTQMLGTQVTGKTVGIIGMGRIGEAIARRCHFGLAMGVVYYNRSDKAVDVPARPLDSVSAVAQAADFLVLAVPGGAATRHLVDAGVLAAMKPSAHLVNIARGDVVEEAALVAALREGRIAGAGLDVYEHEPDVPAALREMESVTLLPHLGTAALEVREAMGLMALENLRAFFAGGAVPNPVS